MFEIHELRAVWFPENPMGGDASAVFAAAFSVEPSRTATAQVPNPMQPYTQMAGGVVDQFDIEIHKQIGRIDLIVRPLIASVIPTALPSMEASKAIDFLGNSLRNLSEVDLPCNRLSIICNAFCAATSLIDSRQQWHEFTGYNPNIDGSQDLQLQINRQKDIFGTPCNRLLQVSTIKYQAMQIANGVQQPAGIEGHALSVLHDYNTSVLDKSLNGEHRTSVLIGLLDEVSKNIRFDTLEFLRD